MISCLPSPLILHLSILGALASQSVQNRYLQIYCVTSILEKAKLILLPEAWVKCNCTRRFHVTSNEGASEAAVQLGNLDLVKVALHPVQVVTNPVHGQTLSGCQSSFYHSFDVDQGYRVENKFKVYNK
jgi:hypothetical protein